MVEGDTANPSSSSAPIASLGVQRGRIFPWAKVTCSSAGTSEPRERVKTLVGKDHVAATKEPGGIEVTWALLMSPDDSNSGDGDLRFSRCNAGLKGRLARLDAV